MAWSCNGSSVAALTDYINNPIYQELIDKDDYFDSRSDERIYVDLIASLGYTSETKKLERNDSKINVHLLLKSGHIKKAKSKSLGAFNRWISVYII